MSETDKKYTWPIFLWYGVIMIGFVVKLLHLLSSILIVLGFSGLTAYALYQFMVKKNRTTVVVVSILLSLAFIIVLFLGAYCNEGYPINHRGIQSYFVFLFVAVVYYLVSWIRRKYFDKDENEIHN